MERRTFFATFVAILLAPLTTLASNSSISGYVFAVRGTSRRDLRVPNVVVTLTKIEAGDDGIVRTSKWISRTDATGKYQFRGVLPGFYYLQAASGPMKAINATKTSPIWVNLFQHPTELRFGKR